jgi:hypothetical protein
MQTGDDRRLANNPKSTLLQPFDQAELTNLQHKPLETPRIIMHNEPSAVPDHLRSTSKSDQACESPLLPTIALVQVDQHAGAEDGDEERVCGQVRLVLEDGPFDGAGCEGAFAPTALF